MKRTRTSISLLAALSLALGAAACKKESKEKTPAAEGETAEQATKTTETATPVAAGDSAATAVSLSHMPADAEAIFSLSFADARSSGLWKKYEDKLTQGMGEDLAELQAACGVDPFQEIGALTVAINSKDESKSLAALSGLDRATFEKCSEAAARKENEPYTAEDNGTIVHYTMGSDDIWAAWLADDQVLFTMEKADEAWLTARAEGKDGLTDSSPLMALANKADKSATLWFAVDPAEGSPLGEGMTDSPAGKAQGVYGALDVADGIDLDVGVVYATPEEASAAATQLQQMVESLGQSMPPVAKYVGKAKMGAEATDLKFELALSAADIDELATLAGAMIPGMAPGAPTEPTPAQ